jgi:hypothetical protein
MRKLTPRRAFVDAANRAWWQGNMTGTPHAKRYALHVYKVKMGKADPEDLDEDLLPGRLIMRLSPAEREALQGLTADMTQDRQY